MFLAHLPSQGPTREVFSEREKTIIVDFYNGGRATGMIEAMRLLAKNGETPLKHPLTMINVQQKDKDAWGIANWRLLDNSGLHSPCRLKSQATN